MKKIISKLYPKNYSITTQVFLIFFITFVLFLFTEILVVNTLNKNVTKNIESTALEASNNLFDEYQELENNYLLLKDFYEEFYSYVISVDKEYNLAFSSSTTLIKLNEVYYSVPFVESSIKQGDSITYKLDYNNNIISINDYYYLPNNDNTTIHTGIIEDLIMPDNINYLFTRNTEVNYVLEYLKENEVDGLNKLIITHDDLVMFVFIKEITNGNLLVIVPSIDVATTIANLTIFQSVMFVSMLLVFLILLFLMNKLLTDPIKNIIYVLNSNKDLNTEITHVHEYQNKEFKILSNEINDLSDSFYDVIDNLNSKNKEITKYNEELNKENQYKKQLVAAISHEIKTPLAAMQATISAILDGMFEGNDVKIELNNVLKEIENTNNMLHEIVQAYQFENKQFKLQLEILNLKELVLSSIDQCNKIALKYQQTVIFDHENSTKVFADSKQLLRALNNIILNAIIYSPKGNKIEIAIKEYQSNSILEIMNYGVNIPNEDITKVFDPFYRVDKARNKSEDHGNGLGLYLVSEILKRHNLSFGIENIKNGVKFYIVFPVFLQNHDSF